MMPNPTRFSVSSEDLIRPPSSKPLTPAASFLLDILRFGAALLVVTAHFSHEEFHTGTQSFQILGDVAVPIFFVLSGFVIRYVTLSREHTLRVFLIDRASRVYSIAVPALLLTLAIGAFTAHVAPAYWARYFADISTHPLTRIVLNLGLLSQSWGHNTVAFCDSPFWSLSYEGLFYIAYGLLFYLRGARRVVAVLVWALISGPQVLFLLPIWWLGCWLYDFFQFIRFRKAATWLRSLLGGYVIAALGFTALGHDGLLVAPVHVVLAFAQWRNPLTFLHLAPFRATLLVVGTGTTTAIAMLGLLLFSDLLRLSREHAWVRRFRHVADGTFAIYLMHYPLMVLATSLGLYREGSLWWDIAITATICTLLIFSAAPLDRLKEEMRKALRRTIPAPAPQG